MRDDGDDDDDDDDDNDNDNERKGQLTGRDSKAKRPRNRRLRT